MPTTTTTPNMTLVIPVPLQELGPTWAQDLVTVLNRIDTHNHTTGLGVQVPTAGININADLSINNFNTTLHRTARFTSQGAALALGSDIGCLYNVLGDAYWNNGAGTAIQLTKSGKVNSTLTNYVIKTGVSGTYTILAADPFQLYYVNVSTIAATINLPASSGVVAGFPYIFVDYTASAATHNITIVPAGADKINGVNANYVIAVSGATTFMFNDSAGNWTASSVSLPNNALTAPVQGARRTITTTFTIDSSGADYYLLSNHVAAYNLTLPTPTNGRTIFVEDITGANETNNITLVRHGAELIDGVAASRILQTNWGRWMITSDGTNWFVKGCGKLTKKVFLASGTFTPPAGVTNVTVEGCGGGGGGGGGGSSSGNIPGGGGGGGSLFSRQNVVVVPNTGVTVTIGAGGTAGTSATGGGGGSGGLGGDTTFGALLTFAGASGGQGGATTTGTVSAGGLPVKFNATANAYNSVSSAGSNNGNTASIGAMAVPSSGGGSQQNAASWQGSQSAQGFLGGIASGGTGGGGGGGGPYGVGAVGGAAGASGVAGTAAAANSGAGGGGGGNATNVTNPGGVGGVGGSGQLTVTWVD